MLGNWLKTVMKLAKLSRAERALTLAIFILFQAMLPSYAGVLSAWSGEDRIVLCTEHGLLEIDNPDRPKSSISKSSMCIVAQSAAADFAFAPLGLDVKIPLLGATPIAPHQLQDYRRGLHETPQSPRAPPVIS